MGRLEKVSDYKWSAPTRKFIMVQLVKKYDRGDMPKSDWLDAMAFRKMSEIHTVRSLHIANRTGALIRMPRRKPKSRRIYSCTLTSLASTSLLYSANQ